MKVLVVHNVLWAHYKSALFESIYHHSKGKFDFKVIQIAKNEVFRKSMESQSFHYDYPYELLFDDYIENVSPLKKTIKLIKAIRNYNPDVINLTGYALDISITIGVIYSYLLGKNIVLSNESTLMDNKSNFIKSIIKKFIISLGDYFITFGKTSEEFLLAYGVKPAQIIENKAAVVDNKAIEAAFQQPKAFSKFENNFVFIGRLIENKNPLLLLETYAKIDKPDDNWGLIFLGDGPLKEDLEKRAYELNLKNVFFLPSVAWAEVPRYFSENDVFVLPSKSEPWGLVVNEVMIGGLPIIISNKCGCYKDLVDGNGFVFDKPDELEKLMLNMMANPKMREEMGQKSLEIIKDFDVEEVGQRLCNEFLKMA